MTSRPDSPSTTATSQDLLIDFLDIVTTQGAYLVPRADTPVFQEPYDGRFAAALEQHLDAVSTQQICRRVKYCDAADEWPIGRTPPEVKEKRKAELKTLGELEGATSDDGSDNDDDDKDKGGNDIDVRVGPGNPVAPDRPRRPRRLPQADWLPTPPLSAESPLATPHRRKRRRISEEDEEKERSAKKHVSFAQEVSAAAKDAMPNTVQQKGRKRRRTLDVGDEEEEDKERPSKVQLPPLAPAAYGCTDYEHG
ncbi:hypothetical protein NKR23_g12411 [Pleurostoma richardsiae]|uniref:Uncharacterized protein n=1 Tax=Pleurostoma richardsiae TaxID=41990 RepID=A0AA38VCT8_9PEZI|nr:hypothetical protein NKR23_g12411 [Pleurostoma richardsiae]